MLRNIIASAVSTIAYTWLAAWVWHLAGDPYRQWWGFPLWMTLVLGGAAAFWLPLERKP